MAYAPADAGLMLHIDVSALSTIVMPELRKQKQTVPPEQLAKIERIVRKIRSIDIFAVFKGKEEPIALVAMRGRLRLADIKELKSIAASASPVPIGDTPLVSKGNGRYTIDTPTGPSTLIFGNEANDLPDDVVLIGDGSIITPWILKGKGREPAALKPMLQGVNRAAAIWGAGVLPTDLNPSLPASISGHIDLRPTGRSMVKMTFKDPDGAAQIKSMISAPMYAEFGLEKLLKAEVSGTQVTITTATGAELMAAAREALGKMQKGAKQGASIAKLSDIGRGIMLYAAVNDDKMPSDLAALVTEKMISAETLFSPHNASGPKVDASGKPTPPFDYVLLAFKKLPEGEVLIAYEKPSYYSNAGTCMLFADGSVKFGDMEAFRKALTKAKGLLGK